MKKNDLNVYIDGSVKETADKYIIGYAVAGIAIVSGSMAIDKDNIGSMHSAILYSEMFALNIALKSGAKNIITDNNIMPLIGRTNTLKIYENQVIGHMLEVLFVETKAMFTRDVIVNHFFSRGKSINKAHRYAKKEMLKLYNNGKK